MMQSLDQSIEQHFIHGGVSWQQFTLLQSAFAESRNVRLFYYQGEVEILGLSPEHELISRLIHTLLAIYFEEMQIEFTPTGSFTQEREGEVSAQADESYFIGELGTTPDLAIEVVITSGSPNKLSRYQKLGVREVWFWEDGLFRLYALRQDYERIAESEVLSGLDLALLTRCLLLTSRLEAMRTFRQGLREP